MTVVLKKRRSRLIPKGARECFEIRTVVSLTTDGTVTVAEVTTPSGESLPSLNEVVGAVEIAKYDLIALYRAGDDDES